MEKRKLNFDFSTLFGLFWLGWGFWAILLAIVGFFYPTAVLAYPAGIAFLVFRFYRKFFPKLKVSLDRFDFIALTLSLSFVVLLSSQATPSLFSGRDQGSYSMAALELSQNHRLTFSFPAEKAFFQIYGPGQALNFPGFNYTKDGQLITQFPLGYTAWLASFHSIFGLFGLAVANAILFLIFLFYFYLLAKKFLSSSRALLALLLVLTAFPFSWFFKFTLSENLGLAFFWLGLYQFLEFWPKRKRLNFLIFILAFLFLAFSRVEAWGFILTAFILILIKNHRRDLFEKLLGKKMLTLLGIILAFYLITLYINLPFVVSFAKGFLNSFSGLGKNLESSTPFTDFFYVLRVLGAYGLLFFLAGTILAAWVLFAKKKYLSLFPLLIALPAFIYVVHPSVSLDHPWMLRRFLFAVIPIGILYTVFFLDQILKKRLPLLIIFSPLFVSNLLLTIPHWNYFENRGLLEQTKTLSQNFQASDLVLVDRNVSGNGWSMLSGPLEFIYHKQAVYFFNPEDLSKIDLSLFSAVYLIVPDNQLEMYRRNPLFSRLEVVKDFRIENSTLETLTDKKSALKKLPVKIPGKKNTVTYGKIYRYQK